MPDKIFFSFEQKYQFPSICLTLFIFLNLSFIFHKQIDEVTTQERKKQY